MSSRRCALITGGTGKIGRVLAEGFAKSGWQVVITSRSLERAESVATQINQKSDFVVYGVRADLSDIDDVSSLISGLKRDNLLPSCLINNARNLENLKLGESGHPYSQSWHLEFQLSVIAAYELAMQIAEIIESPLDNVINISSMYGVVAANPHLYADPVMQSPIHYGICKAALIHLTKELAVRLAPKGVRANAISYGGIQGRVDKDFLGRYHELNPLGRMLNEEDIVGPALCLANEPSAITGHNLVVDGGWSIW